MAGRLAGKVALISGASSSCGMGFAAAKRFVAEGAVVMITDIDVAGIARAADALGNGQTQVKSLRHDVTSEESWREVIATTIRSFGRLDILVNNAGLALTRSLADTSMADFERIAAVNLRGIFLGCREAAPHMRAVGGGAIVNMSSVAGIRGVALNSIYSATKGAVTLFSKSIALELARDKIRCNSVHPGVIDTQMVRDVINIDPANSDLIIGSIPMGRLGQAVDVANCVLFLSSDEACYITGAEFVVDGGLTAR
jgi:NAD(P)-dependent dehydrogenase (short-subunit alcohol dehydrogenase family)